MMESKGDGDTVEASSIIHNSSVREAKYLLEHFLDMAINFVSNTELRILLTVIQYLQSCLHSTLYMYMYSDLPQFLCRMVVYKCEKWVGVH